MGSDSRKAGVIRRTVPIKDAAMLKRGYKEVVHVMPVRNAFARAFVSFFGPEFAAALAERMKAEKRKRARSGLVAVQRKAK